LVAGSQPLVATGPCTLAFVSTSVRAIAAATRTARHGGHQFERNRRSAGGFMACAAGNHISSCVAGAIRIGTPNAVPKPLAALTESGVVIRVLLTGRMAKLWATSNPVTGDFAPHVQPYASAQGEVAGAFPGGDRQRPQGWLD